MRPSRTRVLALASALSLLAAATSHATVTFTGVRATATTGRCVVGWGIDSTVTTFGLTDGVTYSGNTFESTANTSNPCLTAYSTLTIGLPGPADSTAEVVSGGVMVTDAIDGSMPVWTQGRLELDIRYTADQPTIYWGVVEQRPMFNPQMGPPGYYSVSMPAHTQRVVGFMSGYAIVGTSGSAANTGSLNLGVVMGAIRELGTVSNWYGTENVLVFLSEVPLEHFVLASPPATAPSRVALSAPRPNPAREGTTLDLSLPAPARATVAVYDLAGRRVRALADGPLPAGTTALRWDGRDDRGTALEPGLYFVRLASGRDVATRRVVLAR